jgi:hypothetical protein
MPSVQQAQWLAAQLAALPGLLQVLLVPLPTLWVVLHLATPTTL